MSILRDRITALEQDDCLRCDNNGACEVLGEAVRHFQQVTAPGEPSAVGPLLHRLQMRRNRILPWGSRRGR